MITAATPQPFTDAACYGAPDAIFFPTTGGSPRQAKAICGRCPSQLACLNWAMRVETTDAARYGVYGGLTADERRALGKRRRA